MANILSIAEQLYEYSHSGKKVEEAKFLLSTITIEELTEQLDTDDKKKAAWLNIYNSFSYLFLQEDPSLIKNLPSRFMHFSDKKIPLGVGQFLSLDDIEHGILRSSKLKWAKGYLSNLFASGLERKLRLEKPDYRIHFALNCGGKSCPAIQYYDHLQIDQQLEDATQLFVELDTQYEASSNTLYISKLFSWFAGDFGGRKGILDLLWRYGVQTGESPKIRYNPYDWEVQLTSFVH